MVHADLAINLLNGTGAAAGYMVAPDKDGYEDMAVPVKGTSGSVGQVHFSIESLRRR
jgi:hypothetical protein